MKYFHEKLHLRYFSGLWMHLCVRSITSISNKNIFAKSSILVVRMVSEYASFYLLFLQRCRIRCKLAAFVFKNFKREVPSTNLIKLSVFPRALVCHYDLNHPTSNNKDVEKNWVKFLFSHFKAFIKPFEAPQRSVKIKI